MKIYFKVKLIDNKCMVNGEEIKEPIYYDEYSHTIGDIIVVPVGDGMSLAKVIWSSFDEPDHPVRKVITLNPLDLWNEVMNEIYHSLKIEGIEITKLDIINIYLQESKKIQYDILGSKPRIGKDNQNIIEFLSKIEPKGEHNEQNNYFIYNTKNI